MLNGETKEASLGSYGVLRIRSRVCVPRVKAEHMRPSGLLQRLSIPKWKWERITMDFMTSLPRNSYVSDSVWIIVDRLTKSTYFILIQVSFSAERLACIYIREIMHLHGVPYGRRYRSPVDWFDVSEVKPRGTYLLRESLDRVWVIQDRLRAVQSRQKCYANRRLCALRFGVCDRVFLRVSPLKVVMRFGKRGKLSPSYIDPFKILRTIGDVAYELALPSDLSAIYPVFHVSMLRCYISDESYVIRCESVQLDEHLSFVEEPVSILARDIRQGLMNPPWVLHWEACLRRCIWRLCDDPGGVRRPRESSSSSSYTLHSLYCVVLSYGLAIYWPSAILAYRGEVHFPVYQFPEVQRDNDASRHVPKWHSKEALRCICVANLGDRLTCQANRWIVLNLEQIDGLVLWVNRLSHFVGIEHESWFIAKEEKVVGCKGDADVKKVSTHDNPTAFSPKKHSETEQPFLNKEVNKRVLKHDDAFSNAGIWSQITFRWLNPLFKTGHEEKLRVEHIPSIPHSETSNEASSLLEDALWKKKASTLSLPDGILHMIWRSLAYNAVFAGVNTIASYTGPSLITSFVNFLSEKKDESNWQEGMILAFIFFFAKTIESLSQRQWYFGAHRIGIRVRAALMALIYKRTLSIKCGGTKDGKIINLVNIDVERIGDFCWYIHGVWLLPVQVIIALLILYRNLGAAPSAAALLSTIFVMVSNTPLASMQEQLHSKIMEAKDVRIKATSETLKSMRVLKLHSWESTFLKKLLQLREKERGWLKRYLYTCSAVAFLFWASPTLVSVVTFGVCIILKTPLTSGAVLSALATFRILQEPIYNLPELISMVAQTKVSVDRIKDFLREEDQKKLTSYHTPNATDVAIELEPGEYAWGTNESKKSTIKITEKIRIMKGWKVAICGSVGSGKSSLLCSIMGEIPRVSGSSVKINGSKAFVPQSVWMQTGTVRDNVLFGKEMYKARYDDVVERCALKCDIEMWADGDLNLVGERGMNLSGGQKQRIQLARAIYSDSDIYLLDDPFSAVDAQTGAHMFKASIMSYFCKILFSDLVALIDVLQSFIILQKCLIQLLHDKTVVYATHQLEFLDVSDLILVLKEGRIVQSGKYNKLIADPDGELQRHMVAHSKSLDQVKPSQKCSCLTKGKHQNNQIEVEECLKDLTCDNRILGKSQQEDAVSGRVKWKVYSTFVTSAYRGALVLPVLLCQVLFQGLQMASNYWIAWGTEEGRVTRERLIGIFVLISGGSSFFILGRAVMLSTIAIETAQKLYIGMIKSLFRAPLSFFDSNPSSRILNWSSTDQSIVDTDIPYRLAGLAFALIQLLSIVVLMSNVAWQIFLLFLLVLAISMWYQAYYITTARELARMIGIQKAPILHHFSESLTGVATIRCFNQEDRFLKKNLNLIDNYSRVVFHNSATMEWLCVRINFLFNLIFFFLLVILAHLPREAIDPSLAGLAATYGLNLNVLQAWVIWNLCNVENKMISVERILQFSNVRSEAPLIIEKSRPKPDWPLKGRIEIKDLHVQYSPDLPRVLKGITCTFPAGKKIGIVGRTGSGKSTLIQALFRVVEPSEGCILVDGIDISKIGLQDLRSKLSMIPQDPTLFDGTIRTNLDPLLQHTDQEIWEVLQKCHLADIVKQDIRLLDAPVEEDGENLSVGQRQIVCLARVLLQKRRILVLDEATASVDTETDNVIQKTIREETNGCTVITVAHRIPTVIDNDLVLVLAEGKILEFDTPNQLLRNTSAFSNLVAEFLRRSSKG
ncbi:DNA-binding protein GT-1 [Capsicum annuum]|nr:DNA-binding protein GT-1 [Capsicum annuum]